MEIYEKVNIYFRICGNLNTHNTLGFVHRIAGPLGLGTAPKVSGTFKVGLFWTKTEKRVAKFLN